ncbi:MAG TPA: hypothetical protein VNV41_12475 [Candidatus Acidoferrales bacterium]|nr:hypothetical protein [Candidatus Acidoferrales bacterium]
MSRPKIVGHVYDMVLSSMWHWDVAARAKARLGKPSAGTEPNQWSQTA